MLEFAAQYWLQVVFGGAVSVLSLLMKYLWGTIKREHEEQPYLRQLVGKLVPCVCIGYRHCAGTGGDVTLYIPIT